MDIKRDIQTRADISIFIKAFYEKVLTDETIGIIFTEKFPLNWDHHIPLIVDFWETILLDNPVYKKNAMEVHYSINEKFPLQQKHFTAWLKIFDETLDKFFSGERVLLAKKRAAGIAQLMLLKMDNSNTNKSCANGVDL
jgi:hemoglobin